MKLTTLTHAAAVSPRLHRRSGKGNSYKKLISSNHRSLTVSKREPERESTLCDNSDDSGLGCDNTTDYQSSAFLPHPSVFRFASSQKRMSDENNPQASKRHCLGEDEDTNDPYRLSMSQMGLSNGSIACSPSLTTLQPVNGVNKSKKSFVSGKRISGPVTLSTQLSASSRNGKVQLQIINQPEQQHRARYQTEGSRGAVKDRTGSSFPVVKIVGYNKPTTLQVFIGSDQGRVTPHMFYQACRVTGKNSTPCIEKNIDGTIVIEIEMEPSNMTVTCDCVGILKERNVDVEHRFPEERSARSKKKSTRCRMVFRTSIFNNDGYVETLQITSHPIACTQPPGIPEIGKKSLTGCIASGGLEIFILGKNFLKDSQIVFQTDDWEQSVIPEKEYVQQIHLVCIVPPYKDLDIEEPVIGRVIVVSGNRSSEPHTFTYLPIKGHIQATQSATSVIPTLPSNNNDSRIAENNAVLSEQPEKQMKTLNSTLDMREEVHSVMLWTQTNINSPSTNGNCPLIQSDSEMMPPPTLLPRRPSIHMIVPENVKMEVSESSAIISSFSDISAINNSLLTSSQQQTSSSLNITDQNGFDSSQFSSSIANIVSPMGMYSHNYHSLSDGQTSLKSEQIPKLEPLSEPLPFNDTNSFPALCANVNCSPDLTTTLNQPNIHCSSPSNNEPTNYLYHSSNMYNNENASKVDTESMTASTDFNAIPESTTNLIQNSATPLNILNDPRIPSIMQNSATNMNFTNNLISSNNSHQLSTSTILPNNNNLSMFHRSPDKLQKSSGLIMDSSVYNVPRKRNKSFHLNKLFELKNQPIVSSGIKSVSDSFHSKQDMRLSHLPTTEPNVITYQNQFDLYTKPDNFEQTAPASTVDNSLLFDKSAADNRQIGGTNNLKLEPLDIEDSVVPFNSDARCTQTNPLGTYAPILPVNKTYTMVEPTVISENNFNNGQSENASISEFVSSSLIDDSVNTVPKLEEFVNSAAESHIGAPNNSASLVINRNSEVSHPDCVVINNTVPVPLNLFLNDSQPLTNIDVNSALNVIASTTPLPSISDSISPLIRSSESYGQHSCTTAVVVNSTASSDIENELSNVTTIKGTDMDDKQDKVNIVSTAAKKPEEGMFTTEISRMSEHDLLSYINPSCFDQDITTHTNSIKQKLCKEYQKLAQK